MDEGQATFETTTPTWAQFETSKLPDHRHVALATLDGPPDRLLGWIAASAVSARSAYAGVVKHSVHVHPGARRRGVGLALLRALFASTARGHLDDPVRHLPQRRRQPDPARSRRVPGDRRPRTHRPPPRDLAPRPASGSTAAISETVTSTT
ncbi:GNAT family N-acetyltransferase [Nonomuraea sp. NPDC049625]|uniref:GNAT family N-acetyltransferase n=1 Tax=Nonomuraea sp. NPDC049625 TaxID=3155775 RepID=UPI003418A417